MFIRVRVWYNNSTPLKQVAICFLLSWIALFIMNLIGDKLFFEKTEAHSMAHQLWGATREAIIITLIINWRKINVLLKRKQAD